MKLKQILILFILVFILIIWYYNKKEHFQEPNIYNNDDNNDHNINCYNADVQSDGTEIQSESNCLKDQLELEQLINDPDEGGSNGKYYTISKNRDIKQHLQDNSIFSKMTPNRVITINNVKDYKNISFYLEIKNQYAPFFTITDDANESITFTKKYNNILINYKSSDSAKNGYTNIILNNNDIYDNDIAFFWLYINLNSNNLEINLNNQTKTNLIIEPFNFKMFKFHNIDGKIGQILWGWPKQNELLCDYYYCLGNNPTEKCSFDLTHKVPNDDHNEPSDQFIYSETSKNNNANYCIEKCFENSNTNNCNIKECQSRCLECKDGNGQIISRIERETVCPWYNNLRIKPSAPDPPKIRGFSSEREEAEPIITLEWRKPHHNMSKIINYIIEIKDLLYKNGTQVITIPQEDKNIFQEDIENLKPQTTYEICVRAVGEIRNDYGEDNSFTDTAVVGKKSNVLTITTEGEHNKFLKQTYDYINGDYSNSYDKYQCSEQINSDHILNNIDHDDINIYKTLQNL